MHTGGDYFQRRRARTELMPVLPIRHILAVTIPIVDALVPRHVGRGRGKGRGRAPKARVQPRQRSVAQHPEEDAAEPETIVTAVPLAPPPIMLNLAYDLMFTSIN